jgi:predicted alpha/beta hydrolase family esterase
MSLLLKAENTLRFLTIPGGGGSPAIPLQKLGIPSLIVASANDPYLSLSRAKFLAATWGISLRCWANMGI